MEKNESGKKFSETMQGFLHKASDFGKKVADNVQEGAKALSDKTKNDAYVRRMKKYNPLFPEQYHSEEFKLPNLVMIVDDAVRRNIDVCEGAIGWLDNESGVEILCLYDEYITQSGLSFVPTATCDAIYYVHPFDRMRFVRTDCVFSKAHEEKLAELEHIAYLLGAKNCSIEMVETAENFDKSSKSVHSQQNLFGLSVNNSAERSSAHISIQQRSGKTTILFEGNVKPTQPQLKWFANDDTIKGLIEMRCSGNNSIMCKSLELYGSSSSTMSHKTACTIDNALKKYCSNSGINMEQQATRENHSKLIFEIEF